MQIGEDSAQSLQIPAGLKVQTSIFLPSSASPVRGLFSRTPRRAPNTSSSWSPAPGKALPQLRLKFLPKQLHSRIVQRGVGKLCVPAPLARWLRTCPGDMHPPGCPPPSVCMGTARCSWTCTRRWAEGPWDGHQLSLSWSPAPNPSFPSKRSFLLPACLTAGAIPRGKLHSCPWGDGRTLWLREGPQHGRTYF